MERAITFSQDDGDDDNSDEDVSLDVIEELHAAAAKCSTFQQQQQPRFVVVSSSTEQINRYEAPATIIVSYRDDDEHAKAPPAAIATSTTSPVAVAVKRAPVLPASTLLKTTSLLNNLWTDKKKKKTTKNDAGANQKTPVATKPRRISHRLLLTVGQNKRTINAVGDFSGPRAKKKRSIPCHRRKSTARLTTVGKKRPIDDDDDDDLSDYSAPANKWTCRKQPREERYEQLKAFKRKYSHTGVPQNAKWKSLQGWLYRCKGRKNGPYYNQPQLTRHQIDKLNKLGIDWTVEVHQTSDKRWNERYNQLKAFKKKYGHTRVPASRDWAQLNQWIYKCKRGKHGRYENFHQLRQKQIDKLDELGLDWNIPGQTNFDEKSKPLKKPFKRSLATPESHIQPIGLSCNNGFTNNAKSVRTGL